MVNVVQQYQPFGKSLGWFRTVADFAARFLGTAYAFAAAVSLLVGWASLGPHFHWSDSHSLFINTVTTCITFLMVFLIQNTQNREARALHLKLDELLRAAKEASNFLIGAEDLSDEELAAARDTVHRMRTARTEGN